MIRALGVILAVVLPTAVLAEEDVRAPTVADDAATSAAPRRDRSAPAKVDASESVDTTDRPSRGGQVRRQEPEYSDEELRELAELQLRARQFEAEAAEFRRITRERIERKYKQRRQQLFGAFESQIRLLEQEQRELRDEAIARFQRFIHRYPEHPRYTPDAMFRLSELLFERSYDEYLVQRQLYDEAYETWTPDSGQPEPKEPFVAYEPTIAMMQRLITEYPDYRLADGAYYLLGYCLGEQGDEDRAVEVFEELVLRFEESRFVPEVWTRIGEYYFTNNDLALALEAYGHVLEHEESVFYDKAMYKLAWTHYRLADPDTAPHEFQKAVDTFIRLLDFNVRTREAGKERGGELRGESIQYIAISYADESWGSTEKMLRHFESIGGRPYEREVFIALGDVYLDQTRFQNSVEVYNLVQQRFPLHPDAPLVQEKIITAHERDRNFEGAALARREFTERYSEGAPWYAENKDNEVAVRQSTALMEKALYSAALFHHEQAQVLRDAEKFELATQEYGKAAKIYGEYIRRFPHDGQLYELTFYYAESLYYSFDFLKAATIYAEVRDSNADDKFLDNAAFSVVLSYEQAIKVAQQNGDLAEVQVLKSTDRSAEDDLSPKEIPQLRLEFIEASDRYAAAVPNGDEVPAVLYKAAEVYYVYDHFEEARRRFVELIDGYPQNEVAEFASNLVIESYLAEGNYAAVETFTRRLLARATAPGARGGFKGDLLKFKSGAMFKIADELAAAGKYEEAAKTYVALLDENPDNEFADNALNNAAVAYEKVQRFDSASKLYARLVNEHPKSPLADSALFRVGLNAERFFDLEKATGSYLRLVKEYPKSERRADSIYNAALALENQQHYERSARQYSRYCELFPDREDAPQVCFRAGVVYEKMGQPAKVISTYNTFIKKYRKNADHSDRIIEATLKIAKAQAKLNKVRAARRSYETTVKLFKKSPDPKSAPFAAEAQFQLVELEFAGFNKMKIEGNSKKQSKGILKKAGALKSIEGQYKAILQFKQVDWTMASLYRIGNLYQNFAKSIIDAPCPKEVKRSARRLGMAVAEVCDEYRILLEEKSFAVEDKAVAAYEITINKARELQVKNDWTKLTLIALNKLRRSQWPLQKDAEVFVDTAAIPSPPLIGEGGAGLYVDPALPEQPEAAPAPQPEPAPKSVSPAPPPAQQDPSTPVAERPAESASGAKPAESGDGANGETRGAPEEPEGNQ